MTIELRPYQVEARGAVEGAWARGVKRPAIVLPTGAGKTVVFVELARRWRESPVRRALGLGPRVLMCAHREELLKQAAGAVRMLAPDMRVGIVQADRDNVSASIVIGSVPTLRIARRRARVRDVGLVIVDECHHATADSYRLILEHYGCMTPDAGAFAVGVTATMTRSDDARLGDIWQDVVYTKSIAELIEHDPPYLVRPRGVRVMVKDLNLSRVRKSHGDYDNAALGRALEGSLAPTAVARSYREHAERRQGVLFAPTVRCAEIYGDALAAEGFKISLVHGMMASGARADALERFRQGETQILTNCMVLTEGTDLPMIEAVAVGRPTKSQGLWIQMVGRGLRLWPGKTDCLVLDVVGASARNSLQTPVELFGDALLDLIEEELEEKPEEDEEAQLDLLEEIGGGSDEQVFIDGELTSKVVDLFHGSDSMWLRTYGGLWFLPCPERFIVLKPQENGQWGVVWCDKGYRSVRTSGWIASDVPDLGWAMAHAEANVSHGEMMTARKGRTWRKSMVSDKQKGLARKYGIIVVDGQTSGDVSDRITIAMASQRIDPFLARR